MTGASSLSLRPGRLRLAVLVAAGLLAGCGGGPAISGTVTCQVVGRRADGTYALVTRKLTVTDLSRLEGPVTRFWARGQLASTTDASGNPNGMGVDGGHAMALQLDDKDGTFVARDFDSLMAMTIYDHLARGRAYFATLGLGTDTPPLPALPTEYLPTESVLGLGLPLISDNAAYSPFADAFLIFPQSLLDEVPLAANEGVVTHELAHAVFNLLTSRSRGQTVPARYADNWPARPMNLVASLNEGLSDVHGAAMTGDPDFIAPSATALHLDRDLSKHRTYTADMDQALDGDATGYNPYVLGSVFASTFWAFRGRLVDGGMAAADARHEMAQVAFDGTRQLSLTPDITVASVLSVFVAAAPAGAERQAFCAAVGEAFARVAGQVTGCGP